MNKESYASFYNIKEKGKKLFNGKCDRAKRERDRAWMKMQIKPKQKKSKI